MAAKTEKTEKTKSRDCKREEVKVKQGGSVTVAAPDAGANKVEGEKE